MLCAEWWAMESLCLMAVVLGTVETAAMTISYNYLFIMYNVPDGFQIGTVALMGQAIGEANRSLAKLLGVLGLALCVVASSSLALVTYFYTEEISLMYTQEAETVPVVQNALVYGCLTIFLFPFTMTLQGALRALKLQKIASITLIICLYVIALPMAFYLSNYTELGVAGLWVGYSCGQIVIFFLYALIYAHVDWRMVIEKEQLLMSTNVITPKHRRSVTSLR